MEGLDSLIFSILLKYLDNDRHTWCKLADKETNYIFNSVINFLVINTSLDLRLVLLHFFFFISSQYSKIGLLKSDSDGLVWWIVRILHLIFLMWKLRNMNYSFIDVDSKIIETAIKIISNNSIFHHLLRYPYLVSRHLRWGRLAI